MAGYESPIISPDRSHYLPCKVYMLDDTVLTFDVLPKSLGKVLFEAVVSKLQLLEADYFGLEFVDDDSTQCWLEHEKPLCKQITTPDINFRFLVKFYTPDPELLEEELTRYLFALQIKKDLASGALFCQEHTAVLLASFVVQAEVGNYFDELLDHNYLSSLKLLPNQTPELESKIMEHHREHIGQSAAEADFNLLDTARKVEVYGIRMHPVKDHDGISLQLAVTHAGIVVFQNFTKINSFSWAKIRKLCFKRKKFIVKLHADGSMYSKDTVEFYCPSRNSSKTFWKRCIEYHSFFRCHSSHSEARRHRSRSRVVSRGSSFRYCGRTQKELIDFVRDNYVSPAPFMRSTSMRTMSALNSRASTPRSGTLSSHRDVRFGSSGGITGSYSMATGSRTLERSCPGSFDRSSIERPSRYMSRGNSFERSCPGSFDRHTNDFGDGYDLPPPSWSSLKLHQRGNGAIESALRCNEQPNGDYNDDGLPIQMHKIDPSQFMLSRNKGSSQPATSTIRSLQLSLRDERSLPKSPEQRFPTIGPDSFRRQDQLTTTFGRTPVALNHQFCRQERFDVTPNSSQDHSSPPVASSIRSVQSDGNGGEFRRRRLSREQRNDTGNTGTSKSTTSTASFTLTSSASILSSQTDDSEDENRRRRFVNDSAYYIVKELLMTERTYKKDLEVIAVWFQDAMSRVDVMPDYVSDLLFNSIVPIYEFHCGLLKEIDQRVAVWEGKSATLRDGSDGRKIGDLLLSNMTVLQWYRNHIDRHEEILEQLEVAVGRHRDVQRAVDEFEIQKVCYLPLQTFFLKPFQRLIHYQLIIEKLLSVYDPDHLDIKDCKACLASITAVTEPHQDKLKHIQNWQKLIELQRNINGIDNIVQANRLFIREGCLQKLSHKGFQPRMFFLFSDMIVYASRSTTPKLQFRVHGQLILSNSVIEEADAKLMSSVPFSFSIYSGNRSFVLAANSQEEKDVWLADLEMAIRDAKCRVDSDSPRILYPSLKSNSSSEALDDPGRDESIFHSPSLDLGTPQPSQRLNSISHVCWHRCTTVGVADYQVSQQNHLSGYLLRKFKNSNGWQKLWVVFTNFTLFFYKNFQDDFPLATLPLLGYAIGLPSEGDGIRKDLVFKLQFRNHVYFFRADSEYTFERWVEVVSSAICVSCLPDPVDDLNGSLSCL